MAFHVIDGEKRLSLCDRQRLRHRGADEQRTRKTGAARRRECRDVSQCDICIGEHLFNERADMQHVISRGDLGHHAAVEPMNVRLRCDAAAQQRAIGGADGRGGFVTRSLKSEDVAHGFGAGVATGGWILVGPRSASSLAGARSVLLFGEGCGLLVELAEHEHALQRIDGALELPVAEIGAVPARRPRPCRDWHATWRFSVLRQWSARRRCSARRLLVNRAMARRVIFAVVRRIAAPLFIGRIVCTEPLPKLVVPTTMARCKSCRAAALEFGGAGTRR